MNTQKHMRTYIYKNTQAHIRHTDTQKNTHREYKRIPADTHRYTHTNTYHVNWSNR